MWSSAATLAAYEYYIYQSYNDSYLRQRMCWERKSAEQIKALNLHFDALRSDSRTSRSNPQNYPSPSLPLGIDRLFSAAYIYTYLSIWKQKPPSHAQWVNGCLRHFSDGSLAALKPRWLHCIASLKNGTDDEGCLSRPWNLGAAAKIGVVLRSDDGGAEARKLSSHNSSFVVPSKYTIISTANFMSSATSQEQRKGGGGRT